MSAQASDLRDQSQQSCAQAYGRIQEFKLAVSVLAGMSTSSRAFELRNSGQLPVVVSVSFRFTGMHKAGSAAHALLSAIPDPNVAMLLFSYTAHQQSQSIRRKLHSQE